MDINSGHGRFFVQTDITQPFTILTCTGVGDLPLPRGDFTPKYCPDPEHAGKWKISSLVQGEPALPNVTLIKPYNEVYNFLVEQNCPYHGLVIHVCEGIAVLPTKFLIAVVLFGMRISDSTLLAPVAEDPASADRVNTNAINVYTDRRFVKNLLFSRTAVDNTADANGLVFLPELCGSDCGNLPRGLCEVGFMGLDGAQYDSEIKKTEDGTTWEVMGTADPFLYDGGDAGKPITFDISGGERIVFPRSSVAVGEPAEISWSEDRFVTDNPVYVGAVNDQTIQRLRKYLGVVWAAVSGGYIYKSVDMCDNWTTETAGTLTVEDLNDIVMYSDRIGYAGGDNNAFLYTLNGDDWLADRTGPIAATNLHTVAVNTDGHVFVGTANGTLYVSVNGGITWAVRRAFGAGILQRIEFDVETRYFGGLIHNTAAPVGTAYRSFDGGATWQTIPGQTATWNSGLTDIFICDQNHNVVVGDAQAGKTFIANAVPAS